MFKKIKELPTWKKILGATGITATALAASHIVNGIDVSYSTQPLDFSLDSLQGIKAKFLFKFTNNTIINFKTVSFKGNLYIGLEDKVASITISPFAFLKNTTAEKEIELRLPWSEVVEEFADLLKGDVAIKDAYIRGIIKVQLGKVYLPLPFYQKVF